MLPMEVEKCNQYAAAPQVFSTSRCKYRGGEEEECNRHLCLSALYAVVEGAPGGGGGSAC